jgi:5-methylcytosine-specific restriction endonuclease McrA
MSTPELRAYWRRRNTRRYHIIMAEMIEAKGGQCEICGAKTALQFHHQHPKDGDRKVTKIWSYSKPRRDRELAKCQLLCRRCHDLVEHQTDTPPESEEYV